MRIKLFEKFIGEGEDIQELDDIFSSLDLDYDVEVLCFRRNDVGNESIKVFSVGLYFESKTEIRDILNQVWLRVSMSRNMGFETYGKYYNTTGLFWGQLEFTHIPISSTRGDKILINDQTFTDDSLIPKIEGLYSKQEYRPMDPYQRFDKNYKILNIIIHFKKN